MKEKIVLGLSGGVDSAVAAPALTGAVSGHRPQLDIGLGGTGGRRTPPPWRSGWAFPSNRPTSGAELEPGRCAPPLPPTTGRAAPPSLARCNPAVKFPALFALAGRIGARYVSTGHYARVENGVLKKGRPRRTTHPMLRPADAGTGPQKVIFPLGDYEKNQVRALARGFGIPVADKPDSMEICFIPDGDYAAWLERRGFSTPEGSFVDQRGKGAGPPPGHPLLHSGPGPGPGGIGAPPGTM